VNDCSSLILTFDRDVRILQAMAVTRVSISPKEGGPNDTPSIHSQSGLFKNRKFSGSGSDTDIMTSSARAYVSALNKLLSWNARRAEQAAAEAVEEESHSNINSESVPAQPMAVTEVSP
jgi:2-isopropylmalate synthase